MGDHGKVNGFRTSMEMGIIEVLVRGIIKSAMDIFDCDMKEAGEKLKRLIDNIVG